MTVTPTRYDDRAAALATLDVWFDAGVWCRDAWVGTVSGLVCSAQSPRLHDIAVRDGTHAQDEHPVTWQVISDGDARDLVVDLPAATVRRRRFPTTTVRISWDDPSRPSGSGDPWGMLPPAEPLRVAVAVPDLRPGDVLVRPHAAVHVDGHHIGTVSGMRLNATDGRLVALVADVGHRWRHRHVLVPATEVEELGVAVVWVRGSLQQIRRCRALEVEDVHDELTPAEPHDLGIDDHDPDLAHKEAAHVLADEARRALRHAGFTDSEIRHWADAYVAGQRAGDVGAFLAWIDAREHIDSGTDGGRASDRTVTSQPC